MKHMEYEADETETPVQPNPPAPATTAYDVAKEVKKEMIQIPTSLVRWFCYSILFSILLLPLVLRLSAGLFSKCMIACCTGAILAHFAGQLNKLIDK